VEARARRGDLDGRGESARVERDRELGAAREARCVRRAELDEEAA
jgi:hypothetical protein